MTLWSGGEPGSGSSFDPKAASDTITRALESGQDVTRHYFFVEKALQPGSKEANTNERAHNKFLNTAQEAITLVEQRGGTISKALQSDFFEKNPSRVLDLADAEDIARNKFNLKDLKRGIKSVFPSNYKKG